MFGFNFLPVFQISEFPGLQYRWTKQNLDMLTQAQSQENLFLKPNIQLPVQLVAILLQMKLEHANEQVLQDVTLWLHF